MKSGQAYRQVAIFQRLLDGHILNKQNLATEFKVDPRAIQRDISDLNAYLADQESHYKINYSRTDKGYKVDNEQHELTSKEVLLLVKILLASRALDDQETRRTITGLLNLIKTSERRTVKPLIQNELTFYTPLTHQEPLLNKIWQLSQFITKQQPITITYRRNRGQEVKRTILPLALVFDQYYFYLISYNEEYQNNLIYRIDRVLKYHLADKSAQHNSTRFNTTEFRQRIQFMYAGKLMTIRFQFWGIAEAALDRLPTARITDKLDAQDVVIKHNPYGISLEEIKQLNAQQDALHGRKNSPDNGSVIIEAEVYGTGILMWLLSQGPNVKVLGPSELVQEMKEHLVKMMERYE